MLLFFLENPTLQTHIVKKWGLKFWPSSESKHQKALCISVLQPCSEPCVTVSINVSSLSLNIYNDACDNLFTSVSSLKKFVDYDLWKNILYRHIFPAPPDRKKAGPLIVFTWTLVSLYHSLHCKQSKLPCASELLGSPNACQYIIADPSASNIYEQIIFWSNKQNFPPTK